MSEKMFEISVSDLETIIEEVETLETGLSLLEIVGFDVLAGKTLDDMDREWNEDYMRTCEKYGVKPNLDRDWVSFTHDLTSILYTTDFGRLMDVLGKVLDYDEEKENKRLVEDMIATDTDIPISTDVYTPF